MRIFPYPDAISKGYLRFRGQTITNPDIVDEAIEDSVLEGSPLWFAEKAKSSQEIEYGEHMEYLRMDFLNRYSVSMLEAMSEQELLDRVFENGESMLSILTENESYSNFGSPGHYKYLRIIYKTQEGWKYYKDGRSSSVTAEQAGKYAAEIRDGLLSGAEAIESIGSFDTISDYEALSEAFDNVYFSRYPWALKYYQMLYPETFPCMYADKTLRRAEIILGLPEHGNDRLLNMGEIALFTKRCGINNTVFAHIYGDYWHWDETKYPSEYAKRMKA